MEIQIVIEDETDPFFALSNITKLIRECLMIGNISDDTRLSPEAILFLIDILGQISKEMEKQYLLVTEGKNHARTQ